MGAAAVPLIISLVGTGVSAYNNSQVEKQQRNLIAQQLNAQDKRQQTADKLVSDQVLKQTQSNPEAAQKKSLDEYLTQLQRTQGAAANGLHQIGAVSDRYTNDASAANDDIAASGQRTADILSRIDAPRVQRQEEGIQFGRLASDLDRVRAQSASDAFLGDLRLKAIRRNPWLDAAAQAASSYASGYKPSGGFSGSASFVQPEKIAIYNPGVQFG